MGDAAIPTEAAPTEAARPQAVRGALADVARLGPFFVIAVDPAEEADPTWRPFSALWEEPGLLHGLVAAYADRLGTGERRVAASILFQGLASRLWSPSVASAAAHGIVPDLATLHWRWAPGAPVALWLAEPAGLSARGPAKQAEALHRVVVRGLLEPLREALRPLVRADGLAWGNAASALAGTRYAGTVRPGLAAPVTALVEALLGLPPLSGRGDLAAPVAGRSDRPFTRRSCCLYYRIPPGGDKCGDCVLTDQGAGRSRPLRVLRPPAKPDGGTVTA